MFDVEPVREGARLIKEGMSMLANGPLDYYLEELSACYELLITRFSPHKLGDTVTLKRTPRIDESHAWGWMGGKHFLIKGARATVAKVTASGDGFTYGLHFENETWKDREGMEHPRDKASLYLFHEKELEAASSAKELG
jgi:hypothetical protein